MEKYLDFLKKNGADLAVVINTSSVVTAPWVIYKCKFGCKDYGTNLCCPPNTPTYLETQKILDCYSKSILFRMHEIAPVSQLAAETARLMFLDGYYKVISFGAGDCTKCLKCNLRHCVDSEKTGPSMEACGIDVFATVRANGLEIHTIKDKNEEQNYFGLIAYE